MDVSIETQPIIDKISTSNPEVAEKGIAGGRVGVFEYPWPRPLGTTGNLSRSRPPWRAGPGIRPQRARATPAPPRRSRGRARPAFQHPAQSRSTTGKPSSLKNRPDIILLAEKSADIPVVKIVFGLLNSGMSSCWRAFPALSSLKIRNDSLFETSENVTLSVAKDLETQPQMLRFAQHDTPFAWGNPR